MNKLDKLEQLDARTLKMLHDKSEQLLKKRHFNAIVDCVTYLSKYSQVSIRPDKAGFFKIEIKQTSQPERLMIGILSKIAGQGVQYHFVASEKLDALPNIEVLLEASNTFSFVMDLQEEGDSLTAKEFLEAVECLKVQ
jgi:hypothetical protein